MHKTGFYTHELTFWHATGMQALGLPIGGWVQPSTVVGADTPESKRRLLNLISASGLLAQLYTPDTEPAALEDVLRVHTSRYIDEFRRVSEAGGGDLGISAPFGKGGFEIALVSAGLAIAAIDDVIKGVVQNAYALCRPAGHHCLPDQPIGFCLLANIPIAIEAARARHGIGRVAVVDWDVHHGNGTQSIYYDRSDVLTLSLHQETTGIPAGFGDADQRGQGAGLGFNLNVPLPAGSGHETYLHAFDRIVIPALEQYQPELIVVANGLDASIVDPLARMMLLSKTYRALTERIMEAASRLCNGRLAIVHEGGYSESYAPFCGHAIVEVLSGVHTDVSDPLGEFQSQQPSRRTLDFYRTLIDEQAAELFP